MTSRELVKATLEFRNTDNRAPRQLWILPWVMFNEPEHYDMILNKYKWDISTPHTVYKEASSVESGAQYECGEYIDPWGCRFTSIKRGIVGEVKVPIVGADDEEWADTSRIVIPEHLLSFDIEQVNKACAQSDAFLLADCCPRPFEQLQFIRGTENLYIDLMLRPKGMFEFIEKMHDFYCRLLTKWGKTDVDGFMIMDDWGSQNTLLINPEVWREIFKPMYKDYADIAHKYNKKLFMHSDGHILAIIPDLIEIGIDALNAQLFCMGIENLAQYKGKITFWGEICRQHLLPYGSKQDIENAVKAVYENLWENGGCIAQCEYGPGGKYENVAAVYDTWNKLTE